MDYSTLPQELPSIEEPEDVPEPVRHSLYETFQKIPDKRRGAGKRYPLPVLLCLLCLAKMAGQTSLKGARRLGPFAQGAAGRRVWTQTNGHAVSNDLHAGVRRH